MKKLLILLLFVLPLSACDLGSFMPDTQVMFVDQGFKTTLALVELHRIRMGSYPASLKEIQFKGEWDPIYQQFVEYERRGEGYVLNIKEPVQPLSYPADFWRGLGLVSTNVDGFDSARL